MSERRRSPNRRGRRAILVERRREQRTSLSSEDVVGSSNEKQQHRGRPSSPRRRRAAKSPSPLVAERRRQRSCSTARNDSSSSTRRHRRPRRRRRRTARSLSHNSNNNKKNKNSNPHSRKEKDPHRGYSYDSDLDHHHHHPREEEEEDDDDDGRRRRRRQDKRSSHRRHHHHHHHRSRSLSERRNSRSNPKRKRRRRRRSTSTRSSGSSSSTTSTSRSPARRGGDPAKARGAGVVSDDEPAYYGGGGATHNHHHNHNGGISSHSRPHPPSALPLAGRSSRPRQRRALAHSDTSRQRSDDTIGHFESGKGTVLADRYKMLRQVGLGTFGRVLECLDLKRHQPTTNPQQQQQQQVPYHPPSRHQPFVALKIVRNIKRYYESALIEARIVQDLNRRGGRGRTHCVLLYDAFSLPDGHYCMVFESLGPSLFDFLKQHDYQPFPMVCVQDFAVQLLQTLEFLHSFSLIHTDLKLENILLMNDREVVFTHGNPQRVPESTRIKLIDFGGACYDSDKKSSVINTRQYRAPEVILGTGWSMPSDMWSVGCIFVELYQGELLFATHNNIEHLALMERIIGPFPRRMIQDAKQQPHGSSSSNNTLARDLVMRAFDSTERHRMERVLGADQAAYVRHSPRLESLIGPNDVWFLDLLRMMLVLDPNKRATAHDGLQFLSRIRRNEVRYR